MKFEEKYNLKPILMKTNLEIVTQVESKQAWAKPELETVSIREGTLNGITFVNDGASESYYFEDNFPALINIQ